ncbi:FAD-dependent urate hydroxylase [Bradyrhizobium sp. USDA 3686]|uniref:FAD-dependent monooxygenase n=1 Tax=Bradyrhizobium canariense TaxID=255045 RepID=UPI0019574553|nr:FAD-dependent monooxygenase [Bradyrhizobium canariense]MBM7487894.1 2-polyprenyl-6-methoxyphenol hydroxylase-like FAD-dependent oxidoreductase [Bradyrhizobium canariense]
MKALVCGAGVGGLSAAIGLANIGCQVEVFERSPELRAAGAGLMLWPNAVRALYAIGLRPQYDAISVKIDRFLSYAQDGTLLYEKDTSDWPQRYKAPNTVVHRRALIDMLAAALGTSRIKFGHELVSARNDSDKAICEFENGEVYTGDLVIGADGIHSRVRQQILGDIKYRRNEHHAFRMRGVVPLFQVPVDPAAQTGYSDEKSFFCVVPLADGMAYWFGSVAGATSIEEFIDHFSSWKHTHIPNTLRITPREAILENELYDFETPPDRWSFGRITLLGDAAHAMMPDMAQGASQTFIDSQVLSEVLLANSDVELALHQYENLRKPVAYHVVDRARRGGLRKNGLEPIAVRYEKEIEGFEMRR